MPMKKYSYFVGISRDAKQQESQVARNGEETLLVPDSLQPFAIPLQNTGFPNQPAEGEKGRWRCRHTIFFEDLGHSAFIETGILDIGVGLSCQHQETNRGEHGYRAEITEPRSGEKTS